MLTKEEKKLLKYLIAKGIPDYFRQNLWILCSRAKADLANNTTYYEDLLKLSKEEIKEENKETNIDNNNINNNDKNKNDIIMNDNENKNINENNTPEILNKEEKEENIKDDSSNIKNNEDINKDEKEIKQEKEKDNENYVDNFYKNPCLEDSIIFKDKLNMNNNIGNEEPIQGLFTENESRTYLEYQDVNYIEIFTNKNNFADKPAENINNEEKDKLSKAKNTNTNINKGESSSQNKIEKISDTNIKQTKSKNTTFNKNKKTKSKNKLLIEEETKKENDEQKININDKLIITLGEELPFNIKFIPDKLGRFKASIVFQLEDGISFDIDVLANVIGPELSINTPLIDFGLFATGTIQKKEIEIENLSPIKAQYLIRESRYKNINLDNFQTSGYVEEFEGILDEEKDKIKREKIQSLIEYDNSNMKNLDIMKLDSYIMKYSSVHGELEPFEKKTITVSFLSPYPVRIEKELNTIEIITKYCQKKKNRFIKIKYKYKRRINQANRLFAKRDIKHR